MTFTTTDSTTCMVRIFVTGLTEISDLLHSFVLCDPFIFGAFDLLGSPFVCLCKAANIFYQDVLTPLRGLE